MGMKIKVANKTITAILLFAVTQISLAGSLATGGAPKTIVPQQPTGILTTSGNKPISVNGASATNGATIVGGAIISTPDKVSATVNIPGHATLEISPKTQLSIQIDMAGNVVVRMTDGCAILRTNRGTTGEVDNASGVIGRSDGSSDSVIDTCPNRPPGGGAAGGGINPAIPIAIVGIGAGIGLAVALSHNGGNRGVNPSPF
jgi:hypothetical protein